MGILYTFICDGCNAKQESRSSTIPSYWADVDISISGFTNWTAGGGKTLEKNCLLCGTCQIALRSKADPRSWAKAEPS